MSDDAEEQSYHVLSAEELIQMSAEPSLWERANDQKDSHSSLEFWLWSAAMLASGYGLCALKHWLATVAL